MVFKLGRVASLGNDGLSDVKKHIADVQTTAVVGSAVSIAFLTDSAFLGTAKQVPQKLRCHCAFHVSGAGVGVSLRGLSMLWLRFDNAITTGLFAFSPTSPALLNFVIMKLNSTKTGELINYSVMNLRRTVDFRYDVRI